MEIPFEGQYTRENLLQSLKLHAMPSLPMAVLRIGASVVIILFYIAHFFFRPSENLADEIGILLPVLIIILVLCLPYLRPYDTIRKTMKDPDFNNIISGKVSQSGITLATQRSTSELKWDLFKKVKQKDDLVLLYQDHNWYTVFPRHFFQTEVDWKNFLEIVNHNLTTQA